MAVQVSHNEVGKRKGLGFLRCACVCVLGTGKRGYMGNAQVGGIWGKDEMDFG